MSGDHRPEENYVLTWSDLKVVLHRSRQTIVRGALSFALLAGLFTLTRDPAYIAQGTFREKNKQTNSNEKTLSALLMSGGATAAESMAITTIKSRRVLEQVVQDLSLQGSVKEKDDRFFMAAKAGHYMRNIFDNLIVEQAYLSKKYRPVLNDPPQDLLVEGVEYDGEVALVLQLRFIDSDHFKMYDMQDSLIGQGVLGQKITWKNAIFSIRKNIHTPLTHETYVLSIHPLYRVAQNLLNNLVVEADKLDKTLLKLSYSDVNRHISSRLLNSVMNTYRKFLVDEHVRVTADQVAYLKQRQEDMDKQLVLLMEDHAVNIASNDASIEFLVKTQQNYKSKLLGIDLETKHLEKAQQEGISFFEKHSADGESSAVQNLLGEIRKYRQQADSLEISLRNTHVQSPDILQAAFNQHVEELEETRIAKKDAMKLLADLENENIGLPSDSLMTSAKYLVRSWHEKLKEADLAKETATTLQDKLEKEEERARNQAYFAAYLTNLVHLFEVQEKTIQDRLTHQQNVQVEFQGIDLETANGLYLAYSRELHSLEADLAQKEFIIQQLNQPEFEVSSINSMMDDTISREIINKTSTLMLTVKDEPNRTTKELERLRRDIDIQKGFLIVHLKQMSDIIRLREQLLQDKIHSLQGITLELIRQKISIQEKHLADFIHSRLNNLKHERFVIAQHQQELQAELDQLPEKWASQKLIDQHMQSNQNIVHQIASMIESKTIAENLEVSQSAPFDEAVTPVLPRDPRLFLYGLIGAFSGAFLTFCFCLVRSAANGVEATSENLQSLRQKVAGKLSLKDSPRNIEDLSESDLETLRKMTMYLAAPAEQKKQKRILLIEGSGPYYAEIFAALMSKKGEKVLLLPLSFNQEGLPAEYPGLLDFLEGRAEQPKLIKGLYFDRIAAGGISLFAKELLGLDCFEALLEKLSQEYTWIIGSTEAQPTSAEAESLLAIFSNVAVTLSGEKLEDLSAYFDASYSGHATCFLFKE